MNNTERRTLVTNLLTQMPGWSSFEKHAHWGPSLRRDSDGVQVDIGGGGYGEETRWTASFDWPRDAKGQVHYPNEYRRKDYGNPTTKITVANTTEMAAFAKAITRRLLTDDGVRLYLDQLASVASADAYVDATEATRDALVAATGGKKSQHDDQTVWTGFEWPGVSKLRASKKSVTMELNLPLDLALKVLDTIKGMKREVA